MSNLKNALEKNNNATILGVGPMSKNCVDAALDLSKESILPIMLISSRRQIDYNSGYVNNWDTKSYSAYIKSSNSNVILARDHGGPWQSDKDIKEKYDYQQAMQSAKYSFEVDIDSGFQFLHIDPCIDIQQNLNINTILDRLFELYEHCWDYAQFNKKEIYFEVGTEEQKEGFNSEDDIKFVLDEITKFCQKNNIPKPFYVVVQTGTKVMETRNIGEFDSELKDEELIKSINSKLNRIKKICDSYGVFIKEHNADYLSDKTLLIHPKSGIHAANVAPEFGVVETRAFCKILKENNLQNLLENFLEISYNSKKWEKWVLDKDKLSDKECAIISGHYVFSSQSFQQIKDNAKKILSTKMIDLDEYLKNCVKKSILRYLNNFNLIKL